MKNLAFAPGPRARGQDTCGLVSEPDLEGLVPRLRVGIVMYILGGVGLS